MKLLVFVSMLVVLMLNNDCFVVTNSIDVNTMAESGETNIRPKREDCGWVRKALSYAGEGAVTGAGIGSSRFGLPGAAIGAFLGALMGGAFGTVTTLPYCPEYLYSVGRGTIIEVKSVEFSEHADNRLRQAFEKLGRGFQSIEAGREVVRKGLQKPAKPSVLGTGSSGENYSNREYFEFDNDELNANIKVSYNYRDNIVTSVMVNHQSE